MKIQGKFCDRNPNDPEHTNKKPSTQWLQSLIIPVSKVSQDQEEITLESPEIVNRARVDSFS